MDTSILAATISPFVPLSSGATVKESILDDPLLGIARFTAPLATNMTADRLPKSWCAVVPPDGYACTDSPALPSNPCSACSAPTRGSASSSVGARCRARRSDWYRNRDNGLQGKGNPH